MSFQKQVHTLKKTNKQIKTLNIKIVTYQMVPSYTKSCHLWPLEVAKHYCSFCANYSVQESKQSNRMIFVSFKSASESWRRFGLIVINKKYKILKKIQQNHKKSHPDIHNSKSRVHIYCTIVSLLTLCKILTWSFLMSL